MFIGQQIGHDSHDSYLLIPFMFVTSRLPNFTLFPATTDVLKMPLRGVLKMPLMAVGCN